MTAALLLDRIAKHFGDHRALTDVSLSVAPGEVFGLIGPDGAGKTTTMRVAAGLSAPDAGSVVVLGEEIARDPRRVRRSLGYMPQAYSLYADLSVEENLRFFAGMYGVSRADLRERAARLLDMAQLAEFRDRAAGALSGGMYKKLALCCALVHEPKLLLLDEPTNGVDPISRRELWSLLDELVHRRGVAAFYSTPYMDEAARCDRVGLLVAGRIVAVDTPKNLVARFHGDVLEVDTHRAFAGAPTRDALAHIAGVDEVYNVGRKLHVVVRAEDAVVDEVKRALASTGFADAAVARVPPSFEDVFLALSQRAPTEHAPTEHAPTGHEEARP